MRLPTAARDVNHRSLRGGCRDVMGRRFRAGFDVTVFHLSIPQLIGGPLVPRAVVNSRVRP